MFLNGTIVYHKTNSVLVRSYVPSFAFRKLLSTSRDSYTLIETHVQPIASSARRNAGGGGGRGALVFSLSGPLQNTCIHPYIPIETIDVLRWGYEYSSSSKALHPVVPQTNLAVVEA